jgi:hypothetical protein
MNIVIFFVFLNVIYILGSNSLSQKYNLNYNFNRFALRYVIFKEKSLAKLLKSIINKFEIYHNKSIVSVAQGIITYNELSDDEKTLIETVISLCY